MCDVQHLVCRLAIVLARSVSQSWTLRGGSRLSSACLSCHCHLPPAPTLPLSLPLPDPRALAIPSPSLPPSHLPSAFTRRHNDLCQPLTAYCGCACCDPLVASCIIRRLPLIPLPLAALRAISEDYNSTFSFRVASRENTLVKTRLRHHVFHQRHLEQRAVC
ncbi:hypothetical protein Micbo1qcDRAFT_167265, partial [Microdochium bolleyi]